MELEGTHTALITPFTAQGDVDYDGLRRNIEYQLEGGVSGILALGTTGETPTLDRREQDSIVEIAVEEAGQDIDIMVGTSSSNTREAVTNSTRAEEMGADLLLVATPSYNKPTQEGIYRHFEAVAEAVETPIVMYNVPSRTGRNIEARTQERISGLERVIGVKEASGDISQIGSIINRTMNDYFSVLSGDDSMTLPTLALGGRGVVSVVSNLMPDRVVEMVNYGRLGDFESARRSHHELLEMFDGAFIETNPAPIKYAMNISGMPAGPCRLPLVNMQLENMDRLEEVLDGYGLREARIPA